MKCIKILKINNKYNICLKIFFEMQFFKLLNKFIYDKFNFSNKLYLIYHLKER